MKRNLFLNLMFACIITFSHLQKMGAQPIPANFYKPKVDFVTGTMPNSVAIGDIDGDGKRDMVVANSSSNTISVFRNISPSSSIGTSSFAAKVDFATGTNPTIVAIVDVDGDGKPDLVVPNRSSDNISILRNTSTSGSINVSSFAAKVDFATGAGALSAAVGDVDGDSKPDLVVANYNSGTISILRNTSTSGSINASSFAAKVDFATGSSSSIVAIGDLDGDGKLDVAVTNFESNIISVLRNTSSSGSINASSFAPKVDFVTGANPYFVVIGDIDGDGKPELVVTNVSSANMSVLRNTSATGSINASSFAAKVDFTTGLHPVTVAIGDLDGDSKRDLVVANQLSDNISVLRNTSISGGINGSTFAAKTDFATGNQPVSVAIGDLDGDGIPEIAATNNNSNTVSLFQTTTPLSTLHPWKWARRPDIEIAPYTSPAITSDANGNTYVAGAFVGTATFATSPTATTLTSAGDADIFISKYDASGNILWAKRVGGAHGDVANAIKYDGFGNIYVVGFYVESADFDGIVLTNPTAGRMDVYIAKFNCLTGDLIWVKRGEGGNSFYYDFNSRAAVDVAVDDAGNAYMTGQFTGDITFAPLPTLSTGWWDIYVVKYNAAGVPQWTAQAGSPEAGYYSEGGNGIAVDHSGNVYVTGTLNGTPAFPTMFGSISVVSTGGGGFYESDYFIAKYNPAISDWEWVKNGGGNGNDYGNKVSVDTYGNAYVCGYFEGTSTFGSTTVTSIGGNDYFVAKYLPDGNLSWVHPVGGVGYFRGNSAKVDADGNLYFAGTFDGTITVGTQTLTSGGWDNSYLTRWNTNGDLQWVKYIPADYYSRVHGIDVESNGNIDYLSVFAGTQTFDCTVLSSSSFTSLAIAKLGVGSGGPQAPTLQASQNNICTGSNTTLSIANGSLNGATDWKWYTQTCGGTPVGTGNSIVVSPAQNTTYYARGEGGCAGAGDCGSVVISINNTPPTITAVSAPLAPVPLNSSVNINVATADTDIASASINWGDANIAQAISNVAGSFVASHTYSAPGVYTVVVTLIDACGLSSEPYQYHYVVVYDPVGGFVTGGGWINSQVGAYRPDVTVSGKAIFGFESKYQKGATVPTGNTEFKFQACNMNFRSSSYDWLVVSGSRGQYKGLGTINGAGNYGFLLTAVDGNLGTPASADLFRIKIWDKNNNDLIVYDNQYGDGDNSSLTTQIAGGSIVIHPEKQGQFTSISPNALIDEEQHVHELAIRIAPNPVVDYFTLSTQTQSETPIIIRVLDVIGRIVEVKDDVPPNTSLQLGRNYRSGTYLIQVTQGDQRRTLKLIKQ